MSKPLLSILIPTVVGREVEFNSLAKKICNQITGMGETVFGKMSAIPKNGMAHVGSESVEMKHWCDNKEMTIGEKREKLYKMANGLYSWQIDDDDDIADRAIEKILEAITNNSDVDCITFKEKCIIDGKYYASNFSHKYDGWKDNFDGFAWVRDVFYKCVIKTEVAKKVPFPHIRYNEDQQWGVTLKPFIQTEHHIDEEIYHYIHNSSPSHERYGYDKDVQ